MPLNKNDFVFGTNITDEFVPGVIALKEENISAIELKLNGLAVTMKSGETFRLAESVEELFPALAGDLIGSKVPKGKGRN